MKQSALTVNMTWDREPEDVAANKKRLEASEDGLGFRVSYMSESRVFEALEDGLGFRVT